MSKPGYQWNWGMLAALGALLAFWMVLAAAIWLGAR